MKTKNEVKTYYKEAKKHLEICADDEVKELIHSLHTLSKDNLSDLIIDLVCSLTVSINRQATIKAFLLSIEGAPDDDVFNEFLNNLRDDFNLSIICADSKKIKENIRSFYSKIANGYMQQTIGEVKEKVL